ncbi:MAG: hypothetical protein P8163_19995 [Candidatus Thiodiazotropha sp.]
MTMELRTAMILMMAGFTVVGNATVINSDGLGQIALLPYYNINNNIITNINITNTTNLFKAVKVRFHESRNAASVTITQLPAMTI